MWSLWDRNTPEASRAPGVESHGPDHEGSLRRLPPEGSAAFDGKSNAVKEEERGAFYLLRGGRKRCID